MMKLHLRSIAGAALVLALCAFPVPARAGTSFEFLFSTDRVSNDNQMFLNVAVSNYGYGRADLEPILPRVQYVDVDLPVVLFLAHECGRPPGYIVDMRARGMSWAVIFDRVHVRPDVLFVGIDRDPGPPYGRAYGYWRNNPRHVRLSDNDISGLVQVQIGARAARVAPYEMCRARGQGRSVAYVVADHRGRYYRGEGRGQRGGRDDRGDDRGHDRGDNGHGHGGDKHHGHGPHDHGPHGGGPHGDDVHD